jgi:enoyl-CoA hydratase/carnithine racemase
MGDRVVCTIEGGVADVRLDRPDKLNALDAEMFAALGRVGAALHDEPGLRAVVLHGAGRSFCAGLDKDAFRAMADGADVLPAAAHELAAAIATRNPDAVRTAKRLFAPGIGLDEGLAAERAAMTAILGSDNQREAVRAAQENREPRFEEQT